MNLSDYLLLVGDEDGGVTLQCRHDTHQKYFEVCYWGWSRDELPQVDNLNELFSYAKSHAAAHEA